MYVLVVTVRNKFGDVKKHICAHKFTHKSQRMAVGNANKNW